MSDLTLSPVLTSAGLAAVAAANGQGLQVKITHVAVGNGGFDVRDGDDYPLPAALAKTELDAEQVRVNVYAGAVTGPQQVVVEARIDAGAPNFWVKEVGFFLEDGTLFAVWSSATLNLGFRGDLVPWIFRFVLSWTQLPADAVTVVFNGDAAYADMLDRLMSHIVDPDAHADFLRRNRTDTLTAGFWTNPVPATVAAGELSFDPTLGNRFTLTATEALTITAPDPMPAGGSARLELTMDAVGNHGIAWGPEFRVNNGVISSEPGTVNLIHMEFSGAVIDVHITQRAEA
ncbi:phage tail-collar fiber domain-containing protein [Thalassospira marina]|uniref:Phage tail fibre protein N-terminal domain-containing protein n=1 Tax=Thalassospira marina TaxID=2048283 RepID=A0A2N3KSI2_9PROT|nr:phage tail protein [Thalassospira marina]PKR53514.1 hypothetical protein COO20_13320 [Thalassospira marina]